MFSLGTVVNIVWSADRVQLRTLQPLFLKAESNESKQVVSVRPSVYRIFCLQYLLNGLRLNLSHLYPYPTFYTIDSVSHIVRS